MSLLRRIEQAQGGGAHHDVENVESVAHNAALTVGATLIQRRPVPTENNQINDFQRLTVAALNALASGKLQPTLNRVELEKGKLVTSAYSGDYRKRIQIIEDQRTGNVTVNLLWVDHDVSRDAVRVNDINSDKICATYVLSGPKLVHREAVHFNTNILFTQPLQEFEIAPIKAEGVTAALPLTEVAQVVELTPEQAARAIKAKKAAEIALLREEIKDLPTQERLDLWKAKAMQLLKNGANLVSSLKALIEDFSEALPEVERELDDSEAIISPFNGLPATKVTPLTQPLPVEVHKRFSASPAVTAALMILEDEKEQTKQRNNEKIEMERNDFMSVAIGVCTHLGVIEAMVDKVRLESIVTEEGDAVKARLVELHSIMRSVLTQGFDSTVASSAKVARVVQAGTGALKVVTACETAAVIGDYTFYLKTKTLESGIMRVEIVPIDQAKNKPTDIVLKVNVTGREPYVRVVKK